MTCGSSMQSIILIHGLIGPFTDDRATSALRPARVLSPDLLGYGIHTDVDADSITIPAQVARSGCRCVEDHRCSLGGHRVVNGGSGYRLSISLRRWLTAPLITTPVMHRAKPTSATPRQMAINGMPFTEISSPDGSNWGSPGVGGGPGRLQGAGLVKLPRQRTENFGW